MVSVPRSEETQNTQIDNLSLPLFLSLPRVRVFSPCDLSDKTSNQLAEDYEVHKLWEILSPNGRHILSQRGYCTWWHNSRICPEDSTHLFVAFCAGGTMNGKSTKDTVLKVQSAGSLRRVPSGRDDAFDMGYAIHIYHVSCRTHRKTVPSVSCSLACWHDLLSLSSTGRRIYLGTAWSTVSP